MWSAEIHASISRCRWRSGPLRDLAVFRELTLDSDYKNT
jgi:hypothetical protein